MRSGNVHSSSKTCRTRSLDIDGTASRPQSNSAARKDCPKWILQAAAREINTLRSDACDQAVFAEKDFATRFERWAEDGDPIGTSNPKQTLAEKVQSVVGTACIDNARARFRGFAVERPQPDGAVVAAGDDARAVGRERDALDRAIVTLEGFGRGLAVERPQPDGAVVAAGDDARAVGRERDAQDRAIVTLEGFGRGLAVERPQPDGAVIAAGDDARAVGRESDALDRAIVTLEGFGRGFAVERPQPDGAVFAAGDDARAVGRERDAHRPQPS